MNMLSALTKKISLSYREAVFRLELVVYINAHPVKISHFLTGLDAPGNRAQRDNVEKVNKDE